MKATTSRKEIRPQPGYQQIALSSSADIVIGGAAAFVGKTFALLLDPLRHTHISGFGGVIFRRTSLQIRNEGGLWDTSEELYSICKAIPRESSLDWEFPKGPKISFRHLEYEKNKFDWQGAQIPFLGFDELTHFTESMFFYLLSRNRSSCGIKPYVRCTCNPDPESWVYKLIQWWIDVDSGFPILERRGVIRYFIKYGENYIWGDSYEEVEEQASNILKPLLKQSQLTAKDFIKSITFVSGSIFDNKEGLANDPSYPGNLLSQDEDTRKQLLEGCWKMGTNPKDVYNYEMFAAMFVNIKPVDRTTKYITADIALEGSDKLIVGYWEGRELMDIEIMDKSDGPMVVKLISEVAIYYGVENRHICYDSDGVGGYVGGYLPGSIAFHNGGTAIEVLDKASNQIIKENYFNLKTQCYYRSGAACNKAEMKINENCANKMYDANMTVRQRFMHERKAIKKDKTDTDGKLCILSKKDMRVILGGESPDLMDMFMMREIFDLKPSYVFVA